MRIKIVVYERNMSESSSKRGPKRRFTDSERKQWKRESNAKFEQDMDWRPVWRKYFWTGKGNVYILTMKINRTLWLIEVINLFRR